MTIEKKWLGLFALMPALAMSFLDQSVLPVALPTIQKDLVASDLELIWAVNAYLLVTAVLVLVCGKISDRIGHRRAFAGGVITFGIASVFCALSFNGLSLIFARALQGVGAAFMLPSSIALLMSLFPPNERGKASGINVSFGSIFLILGPLIGGYLTENYSWKWIFWINVPISLLGLILIYFYIPKSLKTSGKMDALGLSFFIASATSLVVILMQGKDWGWTSLEIIGLALVFAVATILLFDREKKAEHPFLDLSLLKNPIYKAINMSIFAVQFVLMITIFWAIYFQDALNWSPIQSGFIIFLCSLPVLVIAPCAGLLTDRFGPKIPITIGFLMLIGSFFWIAFFMDHSLWVLIWGLLAFGIGISFILTPSYATAMGAVPKEKAGIAFGSLQTVRSLSSALGVAVIGFLVTELNSIFYSQIILAVLLIITFVIIYRIYDSNRYLHR